MVTENIWMVIQWVTGTTIGGVGVGWGAGGVSVGSNGGLATGGAVGTVTGGATTGGAVAVIHVAPCATMQPLPTLVQWTFRCCPAEAAA